MRTLAPRSAAVFLVLAVLAGLVGGSAPARAEGDPLQPAGEFRPFPADNNLGNAGHDSVLDAQRRRWFFVTQGSDDPAEVGHQRVLLFDPDKLVQVGRTLLLPGLSSDDVDLAYDQDRGVLFSAYTMPDGWHLAAIRVGGGGPELVSDWAFGDSLAGATPYTPLGVAGLYADATGLYVVASPGPNDPPHTVVMRLDVEKLLAAGAPIRWTYLVQRCPYDPNQAHQAAVGRSRFGPRILLACSGQLNRHDQLQGAVVIDMGSEDARDSTQFSESFYPVSGNYESATSFFDPVSDRIMMRRTGPAQLVIFDGVHRRWMRSIVFGQQNLWESNLDVATGRLYGFGNTDDGSGLILLAGEPRTTPPGNGITQTIPGTAADNRPPTGGLAFDPVTGRLFVPFVESKPADPVTGQGSRRTLLFRIYRDQRPVPSSPERPDPDRAVVNLSGESQGYGARVSYVGGVAGTYGMFSTSNYSADQTVAGGTRHVTYARTLRMRLTEGESSAEAIAAHPEGKTDAELQANGQGQASWPYTSARCADFGSSPGEVTATQAKTNCQQVKRYSTSEATYQADSSDPTSDPVQKASTSSSVAIDATRGVITTVTSEGSLDVPGIVHIGKATATVQTWAAGADGQAGFSYKRTMEDVSIAGQQSCTSSCDPEQVAKNINDQFAGSSDAQVIVRAEVPQPDLTLLASKGGAQAIFQRDFWDHEQDVSIHEGADDKYEMPAFMMTVYQDRAYPNHEVYSLAGVQAVSRLPRALHNKLAELASAPEAFKYTQLPSALTGEVGFVAATEGTPGELVPGVAVGTSGGNGRLRRLLRHLTWGVVFPFRSPGVLAMWAFLAVPVFLASRRRLLLSRQAQRGVSS